MMKTDAPIGCHQCFELFGGVKKRFELGRTRIVLKTVMPCNISLQSFNLLLS